MARVIERAVADRERPLARDLSILIDGLQRAACRRRDTARVVEGARRRRGTHNEKRPYVARRFSTCSSRATRRRRSASYRDARVDAPASNVTSIFDRDSALDVERRGHARARRAAARRLGAGAARPLARPARGERSARTHVAGAVGRRARQRPLRLPRARAIRVGATSSPTTNRSCCTAAASPTSRAVAWTEADLALVDEADALLGPVEAARPTARRRTAAATTSSTPRHASSTISGCTATPTRRRSRAATARRRHRTAAAGTIVRAAHVRPRARRRGAGPHADAVAHARPPVPVGLDDARRRPRPGEQARCASRRGTTCSRTCRTHNDAALRHAHASTTARRPRSWTSRPGCSRRGAHRRAVAVGAQHRRAAAASSRPRRRSRRRDRGPRTRAALRSHRHGRGDRAARVARGDRRRARRRRRRSTTQPTRSTRRSQCSTRPSAKGLEFDHVVVVEPSQLVHCRSRRAPPALRHDHAHDEDPHRRARRSPPRGPHPVAHLRISDRACVSARAGRRASATCRSGACRSRFRRSPYALACGRSSTGVPISRAVLATAPGHSTHGNTRGFGTDVDDGPARRVETALDAVLVYRRLDTIRFGVRIAEVAVERRRVVAAGTLRHRVAGRGACCPAAAPAGRATRADHRLATATACVGRSAWAPRRTRRRR